MTSVPPAALLQRPATGGLPRNLTLSSSRPLAHPIPLDIHRRPGAFIDLTLDENDASDRPLSAMAAVPVVASSSSAAATPLVIVAEAKSATPTTTTTSATHSIATGGIMSPLSADKTLAVTQLEQHQHPHQLPQQVRPAHTRPLPSPTGDVPATAQNSIFLNVNVPMPPRPAGAPWPISDPTRRPVSRSSVRKPSSSGRYELEPPSDAVLLPSKERWSSTGTNIQSSHGPEVADFSPWMGNHPEDMLTESLVKTGFVNKPLILNETNTARPSLWTQLKNKQGLSNLSSVFAGLLERRQACRTLSALSSFKPPPRVNMPDSKRETFLLELANPTIPIRRLMRTIPYGIGGKQLLEQCQSKNIPTSRAVVLAKCIGCQQLRTLKRKGANDLGAIGGERKWIRDWAIFVEQFVESTMAACGQPGWAAKMNYAIRLAAHLYSENLVDQAHYLDWIVSSLEASPLERLPMWLLQVRIYWKDLFSTRRRGRRVTEALLRHTKSTAPHAGPLLGQLDQFLLTVIQSHLNCLILPESWEDIKPLLDALSARHPDWKLPDDVIPRLDERNGCLIHPSKRKSTVADFPIKKIIGRLDAVDATTTSIQVHEISHDCLAVTQDIELLVSAVLQWASSLYREGEHRIYLVARLIRKWRTKGFDTDAAILEFLSSLEPPRGIKNAHLFRVIAELIRSNHFSVGSYLRWLIATGTLTGGIDLNKTDACHLRLITEIPVQQLSPSIQNLRQSLLNQMGYSVEHEDHTIASVQDEIEQRIPSLFSLEPSDMDVDHQPYGSLSITVRSEISSWIRQAVADKIVIHELPSSKYVEKAEREVCELTISELQWVRQILEQFHDYPILADVLGLALKSSDPAILTVIAETLNYHLPTFSAIGALGQLFLALTERYSVLRMEIPPEKRLCIALIDLSCAVQKLKQMGAPEIIHLLAYDKKRFDQIAVAVCSPASDNMADILQTTSMDTDDDIERILASGTSMDEPIMTRLLERIFSRLKEQNAKGFVRTDVFEVWFDRLRAFERGTFDRLLITWLTKVLKAADLTALRLSIPILVSARCLKLEDFANYVDRALTAIEKSSAVNVATINAAAFFALEALQIIVPNTRADDTTISEGHIGYHFRLEQKRFCLGPTPDAMMRLLGRVVQSCSHTDNAELRSRLEKTLVSAGMSTVMRHHIAASVQSVTDKLHQINTPFNPPVAMSLKKLCDLLIDPDNRLGISNMPLEAQVRRILELSDPLSFPFCRVELAQILEMRNSAPAAAEAIPDAFLETTKVAIDNDWPTWPELVAELDPELASRVRDHYEGLIFSTVSKLVSTPSPDDGHAIPEKYLRVVEAATSKGISAEQPQNITTIIVDRLKQLIDTLPPAERSATANNTVRTGPAVPEVLSWLIAVVDVAMIHRTSFIENKANMGHLSAFLWQLRSLLVHPIIQLSSSILEHISDVAAYFSDGISEELRAQLIRLDSSRPPKSELTSFIFGYTPPPDGWLVVETQIPGAPTSAMPATPQSAVAPSPIRPPMTPQSHRAQFAQRQSGSQPQSPAQRFAQAQGQLPSPLLPGQSPFGPASGSAFTPPLSAGGKGALPSHESRQMPFSVRRWELLPHSGDTDTNDTAMSLTLFAARKVG